MLMHQFKKSVSLHKDKPAVIADDGAVSYTTLLDRVEELVITGLRPLGSSAIIGLMISHPADFVAVYLAVAASGQKLVLLDPRVSESELGSLIEEFAITHVLSSHKLHHSPECKSKQTTEWTIDGRQFRLSSLEANRILPMYRNTDFVVHCTSGTTARPKGIVMSTANVLARLRNWSTTLSLNASDTILCTLTLSHCHGIDVLMLPGLVNGCTVVAPDLDRISPRRICTLIGKHGVTVFSSLPYMYDMILNTVPADRVQLDTVKYLISGSAPLPDVTAISFRDKFGRAINQVYGLSEIGVISLNKNPDRIGSIGDLIDGVEGRLVNDPTGGQDGQHLVVRGEALARGYYNSPEAEKLMFQDGWLWTQDLVKREQDGLHIVGRRSRFINSGGNKINPLEIENVLTLHPQVEEVAVAGVRDTTRTERIVAFVKTSKAIEESVLRMLLCKYLAKYKCPDEYIFVKHMPKNAIGKIQLSKLLAEHVTVTATVAQESP